MQNGDHAGAVRRKGSGTEGGAQRIGFLLLDNFTLMAYASAIEPLRMANQLSGKELYQWFTLSDDGAPVRASDGQRVMPDAAIADAPALDMLIVCSGVAQQKAIRPLHLAYLQELGRRHCVMGAVCTGSWVLAQAGLLDGRKASIHWECISGLQEAFPRVMVTTKLFTAEGDRLTASGGMAPLDMMLHLIGQLHGQDLMKAISEMFMCDRIRGEQEQQRTPLRHVLGTSQPKLLEIVALMEANTEEPLELEELAFYANVSRRHLQRLFLKYLNCSPSRYYLTVRVNRARQLLRQTPMRIIEIATACGFVSMPHFSKCYRSVFGVSPSSERGGEEAVAAKGVKSAPVRSRMPTAAYVREARCEDTLPSSAELALLVARGEATYGSVARCQL